jgi:hypothetical protein
MSSTRPFPLSNKRIAISPFKDKNTIVETERKYKEGKSIGFTALASLRSMGRIPRSNGMYVLGEKYKHIK